MMSDKFQSLSWKGLSEAGLLNFTLFKSEAVARSCCRLIPGNFIQKETLTQKFSSEFYKILKNTFFYCTAPVATAVELLQ